MATIEFQYDTWDNTSDSMPQRDFLGGVTNPSVNRPCLFGYVQGLIFDFPDMDYAANSNESRSAVNNMVASLWAHIAWFRRQGFDATELTRRIKTYPGTNRSKEQIALDLVLTQMDPDNTLDADGKLNGLGQPASQGANR